MKAVIIGSGNVATHIAKALYKVGVEVVQIWSYHYENASILAQQVNAKAIKELSEINETADLCLISVKDDAIATIAQELKNFEGIVAHTSGAVSLDIFTPYLANFGVFYPLQTFSKEKELSFKNIPICLEANNASSLDQLKLVAERLSDTVLEVDSEQRSILHLTAVFACNFTNHLYALADELLVQSNLNFEILRPLILETADKIQNRLPKDVQTGPALRQDLKTLAKHKEMLESRPELQQLYISLSDSIKKTIN